MLILSRFPSISMAMFLGFVTLGLIACHAPKKGPTELGSTAPIANRPEDHTTPFLYNEAELLRGSAVVFNTELKSRCPAILISRQLMILPNTCVISDEKIYSLQFTEPKTHRALEFATQISPIGVSPVSQSRGSYQPRDFFLVYEIKETVPAWVEPIRLVPTAQIAQAFDRKKSLLLFFENGVRTLKTHEVNVERYYIFPYLPQNIPAENLMLASINGLLYLTGSAKVVNNELFWVNLSSFSLIHELISNP